MVHSVLAAFEECGDGSVFSRCTQLHWDVFWSCWEMDHSDRMDLHDDGASSSALVIAIGRMVGLGSADLFGARACGPAMARKIR
jgi:hypothetical protein